MVKTQDNKAVYFLVFISILSLLHISILLFRSPLYQAIPGWFYPFREEFHISLQSGALGILTFSFVLVLFWQVQSPRLYHIILLMLVSYAMQFSLVGLEGQMQASMQAQLVKPKATMSHREFAANAIDLHYTLATYVKKYEELNDSHLLTAFAQVKPPGFILFYVIHKTLTNWLFAPQNKEQLISRYLRLAVFVWPALSTISLLLIFYLAKLYTTAKTAFLSCLLFSIVPSYNLISMHLDQFILPILFLLSIFLFHQGLRSSKSAPLSITLWVFGACITTIATFVSFAMLAIFPVIFVIFFFEIGLPKDNLWNKENQLKVIFVFGYMAVFLLCYWFLYYYFNYNPILRFQKAMLAHRAWKHLQTDLASLVKSILLNLTEFSVWLGIPVFLATSKSICSIPGFWTKRRLPRSSLIFFSCFFVILLLLFFGQTQGEVARLWMFLMPLFCITAGQNIMRAYHRHKNHIAYLLVLQWLGTLAMRAAF